eukprot:m51a1_g5800 hypothetical protein (789) ;mRNA; f:76618-106017
MTKQTLKRSHSGALITNNAKAMALLAVVFVCTNVVVLATWYSMTTSQGSAAAVGGAPLLPLPYSAVAMRTRNDEHRMLSAKWARKPVGFRAVGPKRRECEPLTREESEGPWVDLVVPLRNRAARLVDVAYNVAELRRSGGDRRLRVVVVDVGSTDTNVTGLVERLSRRTCDASVGFSRAHALREGLLEVYRRWPDDIVFCLDVDMQLPAETFMSDARKHIVRGTSYWAPIAFGTDEGRPVEVSPDNGRWRTMFTSDLGFFASDAVKIGLFSTEQTAIKWGNEDDKAFAALGRSGLAVRRYEMEGFFHVWHPTAPWKSSPDGMTPHDADTEPQETAQAAVPPPQQIHRTTGETGPGQECGDGEEGGEGQPWVSFVVPLFNRSRDLEGLLLDVDALWRTGGDRRMGVVVADQSSTDTDVAALVAKVSRGICVPVTVVRAPAPRGRTFSRAGALRAGLESVAASHPDGIVFCLNVWLVACAQWMQCTGFIPADIRNAVRTAAVYSADRQDAAGVLTVWLVARAQWMLRTGVTPADIRNAGRTAAVHSADRQDAAAIGPCGKCGGKGRNRRQPVVISGEMGEESAESPSDRLFVFYRCLSFCSSSRLHLGGNVVLVLSVWLVARAQWMQRTGVTPDDVRSAGRTATVHSADRPDAAAIGPCGKCGGRGRNRRQPVVISGEMGEESAESPSDRLFVFYRCLSFCSSSRLHLGGHVVLVLCVRHAGALVARVVSQPLALCSKSSYKPRPPRGLKWVDVSSGPPAHRRHRAAPGAAEDRDDAAGDGGSAEETDTL